jgi:hypothetical protein
MKQEIKHWKEPRGINRACGTTIVVEFDRDPLWWEIYSYDSGRTATAHGKLESPWVGPYIITEVIPRGAYRLQDKKTGKDECNPWNAEQLQRFYA